MDIRDNDALQDLLAAEYALGTLRGGARRRFEAWLLSDRTLQEKVARWNEHFAPLTELVPEVAPPPRVWRGLAGRIPALAERESGGLLGWWQSLAFWRAAALTMTILAVAGLGLTLRAPRLDQATALAEPAYVATFAAPDTKQPLAVLLMPERGNQVILKVVAPSMQIPAGKSLQLWLIKPGSDAMVSAGVAPTLGADGAVRFTVPNGQDLRGAKALGLSLEPAGGSPQPTHALGFGQWGKVAVS